MVWNHQEVVVKQFTYLSDEILMVSKFLEALRLACRSVTDDAEEPLWSHLRILFYAILVFLNL